MKLWAEGNQKGSKLEKQDKEQQALKLYVKLAEDGADTPHTYERMAIIGERHEEWETALRGAVWLAVKSDENDNRDGRELRRIARIQKKAVVDEQPGWHVRRASDNQTFGPYTRASIAKYLSDELVDLTDDVYSQTEDDSMTVAELVEHLA